MKKLFFLIIIAFSCEKPVIRKNTLLKEVNPQDFIGIWNAMDKSEEGAKMEILKKGEGYQVVYTFKAERPKIDLISVTYQTKFEPNTADPFRPRLKTIDKINGQYVTFDYLRMSNFPDQISNISTTGFFQKQ
jgi:hypothetical protein